MDDECNCEFDPYEDGTDDESYHFKRTCENCGTRLVGIALSP